MNTPSNHVFLKVVPFKLLTVLLISAVLSACHSVSNDLNNTSDSQQKSKEANFDPMRFLQALVVPKNGIGAREAGTEQEKATALLVQTKLSAMGYQVDVHKFSHPNLRKKDEFIHSSNIIANKVGRSDKVLVLGAHFDSTGSNIGSHGAMDNGAGLTVMLAVAKHISQIKDLPYSVRFIAFGAEEIGKVGSRAYLEKLKLQNNDLDKIIAMVNLDTVAGGDYLYVHSAHSTAYKCGGDQSQYNFETKIRAAMLAASIAVLGENAHKVHPTIPGYPEGETGSWSDHEPFSCNGIPIAYIETTNFRINGKDGYDGYSQSTNKGLWDCFDAQIMSACNRDAETKWGRIWHSGSDQLAHLQSIFPGRVSTQIDANVKVLNEFFTNADIYLSE